jgi:hypothetical protein
MESLVSGCVGHYVIGEWVCRPLCNWWVGLYSLCYVGEWVCELWCHSEMGLHVIPHTVSLVGGCTSCGAIGEWMCRTQCHR